MNTQELFNQAKEALLKDGEPSAPIMYIEFTDASGKECLNMFYFADFGAPDALTEKRQLFALGMRFGKEQGAIQFTQLALIAESWVATVAKGELRTWKRPQEAPNRREALVMQLVEIQPTPDGKGELKQSIKQAEIIRHGGIIDLGEVTEDMEISNLTLPAYFLAGYLAGYNGSQMNDQDFQEMYP